MTRRAWIAISVAVVVNVMVISIALALDSAPGSRPDGASPRVGETRTAGTPRLSTTTTATTTAPDPLVLPPAPPATPVPQPSGSSAPVISRVPTTNRVVFVTIDDGLVRDLAVIDIVRRARIPVTMFLARDFAREGQSYFRQLVDLGGLVEAHTVKHPDLKTLGWARQQTEICGPVEPLTQLYGRRPTLFRPPYGSLNATTKAVAGSCGLRYVVTWQGAANDGRIDMQRAGVLTPGDIILFHFRPDLAQNLQVLIRMCKEQGFSVARLEDYLTPA